MTKTTTKPAPKKQAPGKAPRVAPATAAKENILHLRLERADHDALEALVLSTGLDRSALARLVIRAGIRVAERDPRDLLVAAPSTKAVTVAVIQQRKKLCADLRALATHGTPIAWPERGADASLVEAFRADAVVAVEEMERTIGDDRNWSYSVVNATGYFFEYAAPAEAQTRALLDVEARKGRAWQRADNAARAADVVPF